MHRHHHFLHFLHNRELDELYASLAMRSFALSMIGIFIPLYLIEKMHFDITEVLLFYFVINLTMIIFDIPAAKFSARYGFKHAILVSLPLQVLFYLLLNFVNSLLFLLLLAVLLGIAMSLFWISYHLDFSKFSSKRQRAQQISLAMIVSSLSQALGPLIGGFIISLMGFNLLFIISASIFAFSAIPLFFSKDVHIRWNFKIRNLFKSVDSKHLLPFFGIGMEGAVAGVLWPIFIFSYILHSYTALGLVSSLLFFFSITFYFITGKLSDAHRSLTLRIGAFFNAMIWSLKTLVSLPIQVFVLDSAQGFSKSMLSISFDAKCYDEASHEGLLRVILFREIFLHAGAALIFGFSILFLNFKLAFLIAALASFMVLKI